MSKLRDTHESAHPFDSNGFAKTGLEKVEFRHKRVLQPQDIDKARADTITYLGSLDNPGLDKGNMAGFTELMVD
jgi:hypothetical protein